MWQSHLRHDTVEKGQLGLPVFNQISGFFCPSKKIFRIFSFHTFLLSLFSHLLALVETTGSMLRTALLTLLMLAANTSNLFKAFIHQLEDGLQHSSAHVKLGQSLFHSLALCRKQNACQFGIFGILHGHNHSSNQYPAFLIKA